jgi:hypothetical protein
MNGSLPCSYKLKRTAHVLKCVTDVSFPGLTYGKSPLSFVEKYCATNTISNLVYTALMVTLTYVAATRLGHYVRPCQGSRAENCTAWIQSYRAVKHTVKCHVVLIKDRHISIKCYNTSAKKFKAGHLFQERCFLLSLCHRSLLAPNRCTCHRACQ